MTKFSVRSFVVALFAVVLAASSASAQSLASGWSTKDIGAVAASGAATSVNNIFTVAGSGADVWGTADEFRFVYQQLTGDGSIVTRVTAVDNVNAWVKAGVMMRETLNANSRHAFMLVSPGKGLAFQRRAAAGGESTNTSGGAGTSPYYVKLSRTGSTFKAQKSVDGATWTTVGSQSISMGSTIYVGLAVTSHLDGVVADATFENTVIAPIATAPSSSTTIRVLHWNLHHGEDPNDNWAFPRQLDVISNAKPDIISLNEVEKFSDSYGDIDQAAEIAKHMKAKTGKTWYQYMVVGTGDSTGIGNAIISRFPLSATNVCQLSTKRNAVHATMTVNGRTFNFWSTHLTVDSGSYRVTEVAALTSCMSNYAQQRVVAGDFNANTGRTEINNMVSGHIDGWAQAKLLGVTSNYAGNCDGCTRNSRIDYMFISKQATALVLKKAEILDTRNSSGLMASDHKPMVITFQVK